MRKLVLPGETISVKDKKTGTGVKSDRNGVYATLFGLLDEKENYVRVIPLAGGYDPKEGDYVIGVVSDAQETFWRLDIASPYSSILPGGEYYRELRGNEKLREILPGGSTVYVRIKEVTRTKGVFTTLKWRGTRVLREGRLLEISPSKIPRVIGKKDSMIKTIKLGSGCDVLAGQNGIVWINGSPRDIAIAAEAVKYIEGHSHQSGLTDYIKKMIKNKR